MKTREWFSTALGKVAQIYDGPHATPVKTKDGPWYLSISSLVDGRLDLSQSARISEEDFRIWTRRVKPEAGDVVFSYETRLGEAALIPDGLRCALGRRMGLLRPDRSRVDPRFLVHAYLGPEFQDAIRIRMSHGSTVNRILLTEMGDFPIRLPPLPEQRKIAEILGTWDEAIVLTERRIQAARQRKKGLMQRLLTGRVRFPEFEEKWKKFEFTDLFQTKSSRSHQIKKSEYTDIGQYPIVDQGQQLIAGYTDYENPIESVPVIVFGDHTRVLKWVDFPFAVGADGTQLLITRDPCELLFGYYLLHTAHIPNLGYSRHFKVLKEMVFSIPTNNGEQRRIAAVLQACDREIELLTQKRDALQRQKKGLMQRLLTGRVRVRV